ncbi:MAG: 4Fe-4S binding protein [Bryobacteraceae bacterium]
MLVQIPVLGQSESIRPFWCRNSALAREVFFSLPRRRRPCAGTPPACLGSEKGLCKSSIRTRNCWKISSFLCSVACPVECIYIEAAENTDKVRISGGERYASVYNIGYSRCIFCGYCVEACPTDAITHGHGFELAAYNTSALIYRKEQLLTPIPAGAKPPVVEEEVKAAGH